MNKIILSSLFTQIRNDNNELNNKSYLRRKIEIFFYFFKIGTSAAIHRMQLIVEFEGKTNFWVLKQQGVLRPSYLKEYENLIKNKKPPFIITWKKKKKINLYVITRFLSFIKYLRLCLSDIYSAKYAIYNARLLMFSVDLMNDNLWLKKPRAVISLKDFHGIDNALVQIANKKLIPTYTTQHSVPHFFKKRNFREANIMLLSTVAQNILCWGSYIRNIFSQYYKNKNLILSSAILRPVLSSTTLKEKKNTFIFVLGGRRHNNENTKLIEFATLLDKKIQNFKIIFRLHPTISKKDFEIIKTVSNLKNQVIIEESKETKHQFNYPLESTVITGTSGSYYDYLYLGYKVVYFEYNYEMLAELPRALPKVKSFNELYDQIIYLKSISNKKWEKLANKVLVKTINLSIRQKRNISLIDEIKILTKNKVK